MLPIASCARWSASGSASLMRKLAEALSPLNLAVVTAAYDVVHVRMRALLLSYAARLAASKAAGDGKYTDADFTVDVVTLLILSYLGAFIGTGGRPSSGYGWAQEAAHAQAAFVSSFAADISRGRYDLGGSGAAGSTTGNLDEQAALARIDLYAGGIWTGAERGAVDGIDPDARIKWHSSGDKHVCDLCADRDGLIFTPASLPGFPGEGGFGQLCKGGPQCRCWLELIDESRRV